MTEEKDEEVVSNNKASSGTILADSIDAKIVDLQEEFLKQKETILKLQESNSELHEYIAKQDEAIELMRVMMESFVMLASFLFICLYVSGWRRKC